MGEAIKTQALVWEVFASEGKAVLKLTTAGVNPLVLAFEPQQAFDIGEKFARCAHEAKFGKSPVSDELYLQQQIRTRTTDNLRKFLVRRLSIMLNSLRHSPEYSNDKLSATLVDTVLTKVL